MNPNRWRLPFLLLVTASAVGATDYLLDPHSERMSAWACWSFFLAAWTTVVLAWRTHRRYLRRWSGNATFGVVIAAVIAVSYVHFVLFPCALRPNSLEEQQYVDLTRAISSNDLVGVQRVLAHDKNPDFVPLNDRVTQASSDFGHAPITPLERAVMNSQIKIAQALIDHSASTKEDGDRLLVSAAQNNDVPMLRLLVANGVPVNDLSQSHAMAGLVSNAEQVQMDRKGSSALWEAVGDQKPEVVAFLLAQGANPQTCQPNSNNFGDYDNVLQLARSTDNIAIAKMLKKAGATE